VLVAEVAAHSCRTAVVVAGPKHVSQQFREWLLLSMPCAYLIVSILLRRRRRLAVVVVEGWLRALVSVLLWRSGFVSTGQALHVIVYSRSAVLLLWRRVSLGRWSTVVVLRRRRRAVATATVVLLARIVGHVELRCAIAVEVSSSVRAYWQRCRIAVDDDAQIAVCERALQCFK